ncbi:MAG: EamA family transporter [Synergistaceae bacterium]|nr:EamA family transporter [Synergistaceae bacterium]
MINKKIKAIIYAFTAALLYALNIPISKLLLKNVEPVFMAALLYFGAGLGMGFLSMFHKKNKSISKKRFALCTRNDFS